MLFCVCIGNLVLSPWFSLVYVWLWSHYLFSYSVHVTVMCCCTREVISGLNSNSLGSCLFLVRVVSLSLIIREICSRSSLYVLCICLLDHEVFLKATFFLLILSSMFFCSLCRSVLVVMFEVVSGVKVVYIGQWSELLD